MCDVKGCNRLTTGRIRILTNEIALCKECHEERLDIYHEIQHEIIDLEAGLIRRLLEGDKEGVGKRKEKET